MGLLPDTQNCRLRMRRECRERFPRRRFKRKPLVSDPGMHHGTCVTHVPWYMPGSLTCGDGENVPGIPGACAPAILRIWQEAHAWRVGVMVMAQRSTFNCYDAYCSRSFLNHSNIVFYICRCPGTGLAMTSGNFVLGTRWRNWNDYWIYRNRPAQCVLKCSKIVKFWVNEFKSLNGNINISYSSNTISLHSHRVTIRINGMKVTLGTTSQYIRCDV